MTIAIVDARTTQYVVIGAGAEAAFAAVAQANAAAASATAAIATANAAAATAASEADRAEQAADSILAIRRNVLVDGHLPVGWIVPNDYTGVSWTSGFSHLRYSDGITVYCMLPDNDTTRAAWRIIGSPRVRFPDDGLYYVAVNMASVYNPVLQGTAPTVRWVDVNTGNNANAGTEALPFKTVDFAIAAVNTLGAGTYQINVKATDFIPSNSEGWNSSSYTIGTNVKMSIVFVPKGDGTQPWALPGMRRSGYLKANFAWANIGDGWWKCTTGSISAAAKNTPIVFDLATLDDDGFPTPSEALTGTLADDAAVKAAAGGKPAFFRRASDENFFVKLASGAEPDPGVNFAYVENQGAFSFSLNEGARLHIKGWRLVNNTSVSVLSGIAIRPTTPVLGPSQPVVVHDIRAALEDCEIYGASGNAITAFDINRCVVWNCKDAYNWIDGVNQSSFYTPGNSNGTDQGLAQHILVYNHTSRYHGPNGFKDQPAVNTSSNTITTHSRCNMEAINCILGDSNGSGVAVVGGARCLEINNAAHSPKLVTPSADVYTAARLSSGNDAYTLVNKSEIIGIYCSGTVRPNGRDFYVGPTAKMIQAHFRKRTYTKQVDSGGVLQDGFGNTL